MSNRAVFAIVILAIASVSAYSYFENKKSKANLNTNAEINQNNEKPRTQSQINAVDASKHVNVINSDANIVANKSSTAFNPLGGGQDTVSQDIVGGDKIPPSPKDEAMRASMIAGLKEAKKSPLPQAIEPQIIEINGDVPVETSPKQ